MKILEIFLLLVLALFGALIAHAALSWSTKALLWLWSPLVRDEVEETVYQRAVYRTADPALRPVVGMAAAAGLAWGLGLVWQSGFSSWLMFSGVMAVMAALVMDLQRWDRVAVTASFVWFQRGFGNTVHRVSLNDVIEVLVQEKDEPCITLRRWRKNRSARLAVRMADKRLVCLPKTDAFSGLEGIEKMANFLRQQLQKPRGAAGASLRSDSRAGVASEASRGGGFSVLGVTLGGSSIDEDASLQRAISRLLRNTTVSPSDDKAWAETQILTH